MEDRSNIIKEAIEYRDKLEKKVKELAQSVVRLQVSLDFADNTIKKKDREIAELEAYKDVNEDFKTAWEELKAENERLKEEIKSFENKLQLRMANNKESNEYWDDIFSAKDYPFNKENAYKELQDYYFVLQQLPEIYLEITGGILSKTTYFASSVIEAYHDVIDRRDDEIDNLQYKNNEYQQTLQEIKAIAEKECKDCLNKRSDNCWICPYYPILEVITKAEEE